MLTIHVQTAARTMGELCRKFGERILGEIVPLLRSFMSSSDGRTREGVCLALSEIMFVTVRHYHRSMADSF